jgi:hypothetical protein
LHRPFSRSLGRQGAARLNKASPVVLALYSISSADISRSQATRGVDNSRRE